MLPTLCVTVPTDGRESSSPGGRLGGYPLSVEASSAWYVMLCHASGGGSGTSAFIPCGMICYWSVSVPRVYMRKQTLSHRHQGRTLRVLDCGVSTRAVPKAATSLRLCLPTTGVMRSRGMPSGYPVPTPFMRRGSCHHRHASLRVGHLGLHPIKVLGRAQRPSSPMCAGGSLSEAPLQRH